MKTSTAVIAGLAAILVIAFAIFFIDIDQTEEEVDVEVPDVEVTTEEKTITVPGVEVTPPAGD